MPSWCANWASGKCKSATQPRVSCAGRFCGLCITAEAANPTGFVQPKQFLSEGAKQKQVERFISGDNIRATLQKIAASALLRSTTRGNAFNDYDFYRNVAALILQQTITASDGTCSVHCFCGRPLCNVLSLNDTTTKMSPDLFTPIATSSSTSSALVSPSLVVVDPSSSSSSTTLMPSVTPSLLSPSSSSLTSSSSFDLLLREGYCQFDKSPSLLQSTTSSSSAAAAAPVSFDFDTTFTDGITPWGLRLTTSSHNVQINSGSVAVDKDLANTTVMSHRTAFRGYALRKMNERRSTLASKQTRVYTPPSLAMYDSALLTDDGNPRGASLVAMVDKAYDYAYGESKKLQFKCAAVDRHGKACGRDLDFHLEQTKNIKQASPNRKSNDDICYWTDNLEFVCQLCQTTDRVDTGGDRFVKKDIAGGVIREVYEACESLANDSREKMAKKQKKSLPTSSSSSSSARAAVPTPTPRAPSSSSYSDGATSAHNASSSSSPSSFAPASSSASSSPEIKRGVALKTSSDDNVAPASKKMTISEK